MYCEMGAALDEGLNLVVFQVLIHVLFLTNKLLLIFIIYFFYTDFTNFTN